ncbi:MULTISPECIES: hypothetical protein [unclassified Sphingobium]|uniref:hypothetical protein n=1 Tax=unclassified Sphingobium TaxID=2611147 RepID=UPI0007705B03|nr:MULTISPECIES: hypothetical protein [Sphingomonadaceae]AMK22751.1 hypothetical protein K426_09030 [Sphingobium sp. TKS]NML90268.1 hypothetical protein [Sphingobium sp. TB-6]
MWIRSAFFEGPSGQQQESAFRTAIEQEIVPAIAHLDGVMSVEMLWPQSIEDRSDHMLGQMLVRFDAESGIARMLASEGRAAVRARVAQLSQLIDVHISHINYQVV